MRFLAQSGALLALFAVGIVAGEFDIEGVSLICPGVS